MSSVAPLGRIAMSLSVSLNEWAISVSALVRTPARRAFRVAQFACTHCPLSGTNVARTRSSPVFFCGGASRSSTLACTAILGARDSFILGSAEGGVSFGSSELIPSAMSRGAVGVPLWYGMERIDSVPYLSGKRCSIHLDVRSILFHRLECLHSITSNCARR